VFARGHTVESSRAIVEPDDHIVSAQKIRPDQVVVAVIVYVTREERASLAAERVKPEHNARFRSAEANFNILNTSATDKRCCVGAVIAVEICEREGLSEVEETCSV